MTETETEMDTGKRKAFHMNKSKARFKTKVKVKLRLVKVVRVKTTKTRTTSNKVRVEKFKVEEILDKKKDENGRVMYCVKWEGYDEPSWEPRNNLMKDVPVLVNKFENSMKPANSELLERLSSLRI